MSANSAPKLHNAMWPGLVGKGDGEGQEPPISLEHMLSLTVAANINGENFTGVDLICDSRHGLGMGTASGGIKHVGEKIAAAGLKVGSIVAPVWASAGGGSAMGSDEDQGKFVNAVRFACNVAKIFESMGLREQGAVIRIDSAEFGVAKWREDPARYTARIINTFTQAAKIAKDKGQRLAAEGEICWAGMHSWKNMLDVLEGVGQPDALGFQADLAHTYLYTLGYNAPEHALVKEGYSEAEFYAAYEKMTDALRPWTIDFHVAQNDGTVHGAGSHDKTGKHCHADDPNGKLDIVKCAGYWLKDAADRGMKHICWDGCMFPNAVLETPATWNAVLSKMVDVRNAHGWS